MRSSALKGSALMLLAMGLFVSNDTLMKGALARVPVMEAIAIRGAFSIVCGLVLLAVTERGRWLRLAADRPLWWRGLAEFLATVCFVIALANLPIADVTAIGMTAPLFLVLGLRLFTGTRPGRFAYVAVVLGFLGALMVAKPGPTGLSIFATLVFLDAIMVAARDIVGRSVNPAVSPAVVSLVTAVVSTVLALLGAFVQPFIWPLWQDVAVIAGAGLLFFVAQMAIFLAYRIGPPGVVAPFYYAALGWALFFGWSVFGEQPDVLSLAGIALVAGSGIANVLWQNRQKPVAAASA
jgi:drug/metabolite transporter (DMT)-like permease